MRLAFVLALCALTVGAEEEETFELSLIHVNDFHARFDEQSLASTICLDGNPCQGGFSRMYATIMDLWRQRKNVVLLNAGDNFQGSLWYNVFKWSITSYFMNMLPFTAYTIGNHEFDDGIAGLAPFLKSMQAPCVVSNIDDSNQPEFQNLCNKSVVVEYEGKRIGIVGVILKTTDQLSSTENLKFLDEVESVNKEADRLVKDENVFTVIVLSHCGYTVDQTIAKKSTKRISAIVGAHSHSLLYTGTPTPDGSVAEGKYPTEIKRDSDKKTVLVLQASSFTRYVGNLVVTYDAEGEVKEWVDSNPIYLSPETKQSTFINELMDPFKEMINNIGNKVLGETKVELVRSTCCFEECNLGSVITDAMVDTYIDQAPEGHWTFAALAITNCGGIRAPIEIGNITYNNIALAQPYENTFDVGELKGKFVRAFLERAAEPNTNTFAGKGFDTKLYLLQLSGFKVKFDLSKPIGERVVSVQLRCNECAEPVYENLDEKKTYRIVIPSFLGKGGDGFTMITDNIENYKVGPLDVNQFQVYLPKASPITTVNEDRITFVN